MEGLKLRFPEHHHPEMPLSPGVHAIGRIGDTVGLVGEHEAPAIRLYVDRRGVWMTVAEGARGIHVNGRPVKRMAMLRLGDAIYLDGVEMLLVSSRGWSVAARRPTSESTTRPSPSAMRGSN
jgi:hypothetical protein